MKTQKTLPRKSVLGSKIYSDVTSYIVKSANMCDDLLDAHKMNHFLANEYWKMELELKQDKNKKEKLAHYATQLLEQIRINSQRVIKQSEQLECQHEWESIGHQFNGHQQCMKCGRQKPF